MDNCNCNPIPFDNCKSLDELLRFVLPYVPKAPYSMALDLLRQAYIKFARSSSLLVCELSTDLQEGVSDYIIPCPEGYEIYYFLDKAGHRNYSPVDTWMTYRWGGTQFDLRFDVINNNILVLWDAPNRDEVGGLKVYAVLMPNSCVDCMPESVMTPYGWGIAQWALAQLYFMQGKEWRSPNLGRMSTIEFHRTTMSARNMADSNRKRGPLTAQPVRIL